MKKNADESPSGQRGTVGKKRRVGGIGDDFERTSEGAGPTRIDFPHPAGLFVRSPQPHTMRDPLDAEWNRALADIGATDDELLSLIDFTPLNEVFNEFLDVIGLPVAVIDLSGRVLASSPWQRLCMEFHRVEQGTLARCLESDTQLALEMGEGKEYALYRCKNGLTDCATPIVVEGRHIANLFIGQFFVSEPDPTFFRQQQEAFGFDKAAYDAALAEVPIVDEARLPMVIAFIGGIARLIARQSLAEQRALMAQQNVERLVEERTAELEGVNQELEAYTSSVSHDLRNPLNLITGFAELLKSRHADQLPEQGRTLLDHLLDGAYRMNRLITDLLAFSRARQGELTFASVDMNRLVETIVDEARIGWGERQVEIAIAPLPQAHGDYSLLREVMSNVLSNAVKYTAPRKVATITVEGGREGDWLFYRVTDNGVGFDMTKAEGLFKVFHRLHGKSEFDGNGVGLALAQRIARRHGGELSIVAAPDKGATATLSLPARDET